MADGIAADGQVVLTDFGPGATTESFEGQSIGITIPEVRAGILLPGAISAYIFPSGVALTAPVPNPIPGFGLFDYTLTRYGSRTISVTDLLPVQC